MSLPSFESSVQNVMLFCKKQFMILNKFSEPVLGGHFSSDTLKVVVSKMDAFSFFSFSFFSPHK